MLRKESMAHISLYKLIVRFLSLTVKFVFEWTFGGPALGEGIKWIWPKGCHLPTQQPWQRQQQKCWLSLYTWAWILALQGYNTVLKPKSFPYLVLIISKFERQFRTLGAEFELAPFALFKLVLNSWVTISVHSDQQAFHFNPVNDVSCSNFMLWIAIKIYSFHWN